MTGRALSLPCEICGGTITLNVGDRGVPTMAVDAFVREHAACVAELAAAGGLGDTHAGRRRRLIREAMHRAHDGPHGILRTISETEVEFLLGPVLNLLEDAEERLAARPRVIRLDDEQDDDAQQRRPSTPA